MAEETKDIQRTKDQSGDVLFLVQASHVKKQNSSSDNTDLLRHVTGRDWQFSDLDTEQFEPTMSVDRQPSMYEFISLRMSEERILDNGTAVQEISVTHIPIGNRAPTVGANATLKSSFDKFFSDVLSAPDGITFEDHACRFNIYEKKSNEAEESAGILNLYMNVEKNYNFLDSDYEALVTYSDTIREVNLPNFYNVVFHGSEPVITESEEKPTVFSLSNVSRNIVTLNGRIPSPRIYYDPAFHSVQRQRSKSIEHLGANGNPVRRYYSDYSNAIDSAAPQSEMFLDTEKQIRTFFSKEDTRRMSEVSKFREMFPMYTRIVFNTEFESGFGELLSETNYTSRIRDFIDTAKTKDVKRVDTYEIISRMSENGFKTLNQYDPETTYEPPSKRTRKFYDVDDFFEKHFDNDPIDSFHFSGDDTSSAQGRYRAYNSLMTVIARAKIEKIKRDKFRTFNDVLQGKTSHTETVMYVLRKYNQNDDLIQVFYFANSKDLSEVDFIDTQVKYGKKYRYELSVVKLVVGTEYTYTSLQADASENRKNYKVVSKPSLKLVEVSLISGDSLILDSLPLPPEFYPVPIANVNNRVKWMLNSSMGRAMLKPITFTNEEVENINQQRIAQKVPPEQEKIMYETDDGVNEFEIYRLAFAPRTYEDFYQNGERIGARTSFDDMSVASSSSYEDKIQPNEKYYYCARAVDSHANISNPTMVWEIELVSESGTCYPKFREYEMQEKKTKNFKKSAKRFVQISPAHLQKVVNDQASGIGPEGPSGDHKNISLGVAEKTVWGKKFKLRLTSKATGKKVDFNFTFKSKPMDEFLQS